MAGKGRGGIKPTATKYDSAGYPVPVAKLPAGYKPGMTGTPYKPPQYTPEQLSNNRVDRSALGGYFRYVGNANDTDPYDWPSTYSTNSDGGGGGGGGGGGPTTYTSGQGSAMIDLLRQFAPQMQEFTPYNIDPAMYDSMRRSVRGARRADTRQANATYDNLDQTLAGFTNPYASVPATATPMMENAYSRLLGAAGSGAVQQGINEENAYSQNADAGFANALGLLSGVWGAGQQSRQSQAEQDRINAVLGIGADARGQRYGIDAAQGAAQQNANLYNNQGMNSTNAANAGTKNSSSWNVLDALLALIPNLDPTALAKLTGG